MVLWDDGTVIPNTQETEARVLQVQDQLGLHSVSLFVKGRREEECPKSKVAGISTMMVPVPAKDHKGAHSSTHYL